MQHVFAHPRAFQVSGFSRKALRFRGRMSTDMAKSHVAWGKASRRVLAARACRSRHVKRSAYTVVKRAVRVWKSQQDSRVTKAGPRASCTFDRVTLYEVCCSSNSATSRKVTQSGGAAVRVLWPPTYVPQFARHLKRDPPSRNVQASLLPQLRQPVAEQKPEKWFLNMDWPVHQMVLLKKIQTVRPAPGTTKVVLLTSPQCRMFATLQRIQHAKGVFDWEAHGVAMRRLRFMRRLHRAWTKRRRDAAIRGAAIHEQPPQSSQNLLKKYEEPKDFPWAIGRNSLRRTVNGCMCGTTSASGLPVFKGWRFEVASPMMAAALSNHQCDRSHKHAPTSMNYRAQSGTGNQSLLRVSNFEVYTGTWAHCCAQLRLRASAATATSCMLLRFGRGGAARPAPAPMSRTPLAGSGDRFFAVPRARPRSTGVSRQILRHHA